MKWRYVHRVVRRVWITGGLAFTAWMVWSFQAHGLPAGTFESDERVRVERVEGGWRFHPVGSPRGVGLVFLPGGMVDPRAYGPLARSLAREGYPVALVELPWRIARGADGERVVAERARQARGAIGPETRWVLAGHSRGAAIATRLAAAEPGAYDGFAFIATTHPRVDLSHLTVPVFKIGGTGDCVAPRERSEAARGLLPPHTEWRWIEGANHARFGYYGSQLGDCGATLTREQQLGLVVASLRDLLDAAEATGG